MRAHTRRTYSVLSDWIRTEVRLAPGMTVLELACGPGDMAAELAPSIVPGGQWLATDRSRNMIEAAGRVARDANLERVIQPSVQDIEALTLRDASVDAVVCRFGIMLVPDPPAVLGEAHRVMRRGARAGFVVWAPASDNPWAERLFDVLDQAFDLPPAEPGSPGMFALDEPERLATLARKAGFGGYRVDSVEVAFRYASFDEFWDTHSALSGQASRMLRAAPPTQVDHIKAQVRAAVAEFRRPDGAYSLPGRTLCLVAEA